MGYVRLWLDNFEDADVTDWTVTNASWTASLTQPKNGLYSGKLLKGTNNSFNAKKSFTRQTGIFKFDLWIYIFDNGQLDTGEAFYLLGYDNATQIIYTMFHNNHKIYGFNGTSTYETGLTWSDSTWHHVVLIGNIATNLIDLYVDDVKATTYGFQIANPLGVTTICAMGYVYDTGSCMYWDDVDILYWVMTRPSSGIAHLAEAMGIV